MLAWLVCLLPLALAAPSEHIIGGDPVTDPGRHPWQVSQLPGCAAMKSLCAFIKTFFATKNTVESLWQFAYAETEEFGKE